MLEGGAVGILSFSKKALSFHQTFTNFGASPVRAR